MSFTPPFTTTYTKGDLFYGFGAPRLALMKYLGVPTSESGMSALFMINNYLGTGDEIALAESKIMTATEKHVQTAKDTFIKKHPEYEDVRTLKFSDPKKKEFFQRAEKEFGIKQSEVEEAFKSSLLQPHRNFWDALNTFKGGKYADALSFKRSGLTSGNADAAENAAWRKKCKGGIYYGSHVLDKTVHFCLSLEVKTGETITGWTDLDFKAVVTKTSLSDSAATVSKEDKIRLITPAELRWVYRHREDSSVKKNIQFWTHSGTDVKTATWVACGPPWESSQPARELWASYKPKSTSVHAKTD